MTTVKHALVVAAAILLVMAIDNATGRKLSSLVAAA